MVDLSAWSDFLAAEVGATAALLGLFFVALSLNLSTVLASGGLPERAQQALIQLLASLLVGLLLLMPGQSLFAAGFETFLLALAVGIFGAFLAIRSMNRRKGHGTAFTMNLLFFALSLLPWFVGGLMMIIGNANGAYWLAVGICLSIAKAAVDSWVFLVEINR